MPKKKIIQRHHISYKPEHTVLIYKNEHWLIVQRDRNKSFSQGYITDTEVWLALQKNKAVELTEEMRKKKAE